MSQPATYTITLPSGEVVGFCGERLTKKQLEIVIQFHRDGLLVPGGIHHFESKSGRFEYNPKTKGCINQHLFKDGDAVTACKRNSAVAKWFDINYKPTWADWMLREAMINAKMVEE
jgi:hypothetical protein